MCWSRAGDSQLSDSVCVCVCLSVEASPQPVPSSSGVMGHDESEPNQCALPLVFIPELSAAQPQQWPGNINTI